MRVAIVTALLSLALPAAAGSSGTTGLRGHVRIGPLTPVCKAGVPCSGPARNVTLSFGRSGRVTKVLTDSTGAYRVRLGAGRYAVHSSRGMGIRPATVIAVRDRMRIVDLAIDTGIR